MWRKYHVCSHRVPVFIFTKFVIIQIVPAIPKAWAIHSNCKKNGQQVTCLHQAAGKLVILRKLLLDHNHSKKIWGWLKYIVPLAWKSPRIDLWNLFPCCAGTLHVVFQLTCKKGGGFIKSKVWFHAGAIYPWMSHPQCFSVHTLLLLGFLYFVHLFNFSPFFTLWT